MTLPPLAFRADMLLLIVLYHLFATNENCLPVSNSTYTGEDKCTITVDESDVCKNRCVYDRMGHEDLVDPSLFLSNALTLTMVKSFEASALRVSMLPP